MFFRKKENLMKRHILRVFLLVSLVIPSFLSHNLNEKSLAPQTEIMPAASIKVYATSTPIPTLIHIPTIYPTPTSDRSDFDSRIKALTRLGLYEEAIAEFNSSSIYKLDPFTYTNLCLENALYRKAADSLPICDLAVQEFPDYEEALFARGIARSRAGDFEGAIIDFEKFLEIIDKPQDKIYNSKTFRFETDIYIFENRIRSWIEILKTDKNPITEDEIVNIPVFKFTSIFSSDYEFDQMAAEQRALFYLKSYEDAMNFFYNYDSGRISLYYMQEEELNPEIRQQDYLTRMMNLDMFAYSTACMRGCFAGDMDKVNLYCEKADQIYQSLPDYIDSEDQQFFTKMMTISTGIYLVYRGDYEEAKSFFEDYLVWQKSSEYINNSALILDTTIEEWINKLGENQFPFTQEEVYTYLHIFPWS